VYPNDTVRAAARRDCITSDFKLPSALPFSVRPVENGSERGCAATVDSIRMRKKFVPPDSSPMWPFGNGFPVLDVAYYIERKATLAIPGRCETVD
jgi:hypothetical protein